MRDEKWKEKTKLIKGNQNPLRILNFKTLGKKYHIKKSKPLYKGNHSKMLGINRLFRVLKNTLSKPNFPSKTPASTSDFERRNPAEQRATKRLRGEDENKDKI